MMNVERYFEMEKEAREKGRRQSDLREIAPLLRHSKFESRQIELKIAFRNVHNTDTTFVVVFTQGDLPPEFENHHIKWKLIGSYTFHLTFPSGHMGITHIVSFLSKLLNSPKVETIRDESKLDFIPY
jgi:hypothetical protein